MKNSYLLPILAFIPLGLIIIALSQLDYSFTPLSIGVLIGIYLAINIAYSLVRGTFHVSILVELSLISLLAFYILASLV